MSARKPCLGCLSEVLRRRREGVLRQVQIVADEFDIPQPFVEVLRPPPLATELVALVPLAQALDLLPPLAAQGIAVAVGGFVDSRV